jgi:hypothetical protein
MCPSIESAESSFAADVLRNLLRHIDQENAQGNAPFLVSHGWTEGPVMYLVYTAPPSDIAWGLVRDTRESNMDPAPWPSLNLAVRYYYLLDLVEDRMSEGFPHPGDPATILWHGDQSPGEDPCEGLPQRVSDIPDAYRYTAPVPPLSAHKETLSNIEPRRYADPI